MDDENNRIVEEKEDWTECHLWAPSLVRGAIRKSH